LTLPGALARVWDVTWPALALVAGLALGAGIAWLGMQAGLAEDRPGEVGKRLAHGAKLYCQLPDEGRAEAERRLFYELPSDDRVRVTVECAR
jgi:hypothetical protein